MKILGTVYLLTIHLSSFGQYYVAKDFTAENTFSTNIEGPNIDSKGNFFIVNYQKDGTIGLVRDDGTVEVYVTLPEGSIGNAIMFDKKEDLLIADFKGHNILKVNRKNRKISVYSHDNFNQPNDICINKKGQLFASDPNWKEGTGKIWRIDTNGKASLLVSDMGTTNGIELSPDEQTLYINESVQRKIWAFEINETGGLQHKRLFAKFEDFGLDGMKCDAKGNLYVTRYGKGVIAVFSPQGKLIREISVTGKKTSNLTFGGKDGRTCYVTLQDRRCVETFMNETPGRNR